MSNQKHQMKWILFWVFLLLFVIMVICTLSMVFLGFGSPTADERSLLVKMLIGEVAASVIALFYSIFGINEKSSSDDEIQNEKIQEILLEIEKLGKRIGTIEITGSLPSITEHKEIKFGITPPPFRTDSIIDGFDVKPPFPLEEYRLNPLPKEIEEDLSKSKPFDLKHREQSYIGSKIQWKVAFRSINKGKDNTYKVRAQAGFLHTVTFEIDESSSFLLRHLELDTPFWVCGEISELSSLYVELKSAKIHTGD